MSWEDDRKRIAEEKDKRIKQLDVLLKELITWYSDAEDSSVTHIQSMQYHLEQLKETPY